MDKKLKIILFPTIMLLMFFPIVSAVDWQTEISFTGPSSQSTNYFYIPTNEWRINWNYTLDEAFPDGTSFSLFVYAKGNETAVTSVKSTPFSGGARSGVLSIHEGLKEYFLKITAANAPTYDVLVQYTSSSRTPLATSTPTQAATATPYSSQNPNPTPTVPELQTWIILPIFLVIVLMTLLSIVLIRKRIPKK